MVPTNFKTRPHAASSGNGVPGTEDRFDGCVFGHVVGSALGLGCSQMLRKEVLEAYPEGLRHYKDIHPDAFRGHSPGDCSGESSMALALARSLAENSGKLSEHSASRLFLSWMDSRPGDLSGFTALVLSHPGFIKTPRAAARRIWETTGKDLAPNGSLARACPAALIPDTTPGKTQLLRTAAAASEITHADPRCLGACAAFSLMANTLVYEGRPAGEREIVACAMNFSSKAADSLIAAKRIHNIDELCLDRDTDFDGVLKTLCAAFWALYHAKDFIHGLQSVILQGGDSASNGAVAGALLGAKFGIRAIPADLVAGIREKERLRGISGTLKKIWQPRRKGS